MNMIRASRELTVARPASVRCSAEITSIIVGVPISFIIIVGFSIISHFSGSFLLTRKLRCRSSRAQFFSLPHLREAVLPVRSRMYVEDLSRKKERERKSRTKNTKTGCALCLYRENRRALDPSLKRMIITQFS